MSKSIHKIVLVDSLTPETFILTLEKNGFEFKAGQYVIIRDPIKKESREYSVYSGENDQYLEFLIREVKDGDFSRYLRHLTKGTELEIEGPKGFFIPDENVLNGNPVLFVATGTGISPFRSFVRTYPNLNYQLLHGVRFDDEAYAKDDFLGSRRTICTSRVNNGDFFGRVTYHLKINSVDPSMICYLCGNSDMIEEVTTILESYNIPPENIKSEVFF